MKDTIKTLSFRFPAHLLEEIREAATATPHHRSLGGEIMTAIEKHVKKQPKRKKARDKAGI